jgi:hypothetical protein
MGKSALCASLLLLYFNSVHSQNLPDAPSAKWQIISNSVNVASTFALARSLSMGSRDCVAEVARHHAVGHWNPRAEYHHALMIGAAIDGGVWFGSWKLRKSHPGLSRWLPLLSATSQFSIAGSQYSSGCA